MHRPNKTVRVLIADRNITDADAAASRALMRHEAMMDRSEVPPGWTYSPSTYLQRIPIVGLGLIGVVLARSLRV